MNAAESTETMQSDVSITTTTSTIPADDLMKPITPFKVIFETVQDGKSCVNLFDKVEIKKQDLSAKDSKTKSSSGLFSMLSGGGSGANSSTKKEASSKMEVDDFEVIEKFTEYLMYLEGEQPLEERKMEDQKAEIIVVVDKSGSMGGTPWKQVQSALIKMLDITRGVNNCKAIAYNQCAETLNLSESRSKDKTMINSIRASGSTNFVAVFEALGKIFKNEKKKNSTVPHYIFMMTDGEDTCNKTEEIENAKEHLQVAIEGFGGEVIFNVLGFAEHHNEDFLESLALIGTSDGSYSFVSPKEGEKALEERLVQLVESTSESIGKIINIEVLGENVEFLGEWFGESEKEVILPAKLSKKEDKITISTRKFVRIPNDEDPKMILKIHEKLRGNSEPQEAKIISMEKIELSQKDVIDAHNLKKLRSAMNLISARMADIDEASKDTEAKAAYEMIKNKMNALKGLNIANSDVKRLKQNVSGYLRTCDLVFQPNTGYSDRETMLLSRAMRSVQTSGGQMQNLYVQSRSDRTEEYRSTSKTIRTDLQYRVRQTDFSKDSDGSDSE